MAVLVAPASLATMTTREMAILMPGTEESFPREPLSHQVCWGHAPTLSWHFLPPHPSQEQKQTSCTEISSITHSVHLILYLRFDYQLLSSASPTLQGQFFIIRCFKIWIYRKLERQPVSRHSGLQHEIRTVSAGSQIVDRFRPRTRRALLYFAAAPTRHTTAIPKLIHSRKVDQVQRLLFFLTFALLDFVAWTSKRMSCQMFEPIRRFVQTSNLPNNTTYHDLCMRPQSMMLQSLITKGINMFHIFQSINQGSLIDFLIAQAMKHKPI